MSEQQHEQGPLDAGGPVVIEVWAPWCSPCRAMAPHLEQVRQEYEGRVTLYKINADAAPEMVRTLGVMSIPTVIVRHEGREVGRRTGFQGVEALRTLFEAALTPVPGVQLGGPSPVDRLLRIAAGLALVGIAAFSGWPWFLLLAAAVVLFSAIHDRCPLWQAVRSHLLPSRGASSTPANEPMT